MTHAERQDATAIRIGRRFAAPAQSVFEAWTSAELLRRWYPPGPDGDTPVAELDLRVGGRLRLVMRSPDAEHPDGITTVVMTNRGLVEEQARESHRAGWEGSFDNLARLVAR